jgi:hypothetical protein
MFLITWIFDKLGYMPKIKVDAGMITAWPFPVKEEAPIKKPTVKKATTRTTKKPAVVAKTARAKKAK